LNLHWFSFLTSSQTITERYPFPLLPPITICFIAPYLPQRFFSLLSFFLCHNPRWGVVLSTPVSSFFSSSFPRGLPHLNEAFLMVSGMPNICLPSPFAPPPPQCGKTIQDLDFPPTTSRGSKFQPFLLPSLLIQEWSEGNRNGFRTPLICEVNSACMQSPPLLPHPCFCFLFPFSAPSSCIVILSTTFTLILTVQISEQFFQDLLAAH